MINFDRRQFLGLVGAGTAGLILSGCVRKPASSDASGPTIKAADPATAKGTVEYWNHFTGADERLGFEAVTSGFAKKYPGVTLSNQSIPLADFMTKFTTAVQAKTTPDALMVIANRVNEMVGMNGLIDLTAAVSAWSGHSDIADKLISPFQRNGKTYAIPAALFVDWFYYRKDWLDEAGVTTPPATWQEFRAVAKEITTSKRYGFALRGGSGGGEPILKMIRAYNGPFVDGGGAPTLKADAVAAALEEYSAPYLIDKSAPPSAPADGYNQIFQSLFTGQAGMLWHHTGSLKSVSAALHPTVQVMTAPLPSHQGSEMGWVQPLGNGLASTANAENALAWLEYWGSAQPQVDMFKATGYFPASTPGQTLAGSTPMLDAALTTVKKGITPEYFNGMSAWQDNTVLVQYQSLLVGKTTISAAANVIVADFKKNF
ncbi:MAG: hypothetical protein B5766_02480 [Candidatus Lumbricidophila eiseniae]|uniref:Sugar ABC transporter substrate-binding protein n=1 Tax=Candidatus Lumbricidiphila eiseniae TaxID=1969409 RepID=A0A2A6FTP5_9MICO|nr:MAG: hypothetical protein B5766_02480 [Candidatus Lumbricidophila eiseniae]